MIKKLMVFSNNHKYIGYISYINDEFVWSDNLNVFGIEDKRFPVYFKDFITHYSGENKDLLEYLYNNYTCAQNAFYLIPDEQINYCTIGLSKFLK